jgi:hypothetical protein
VQQINLFAELCKDRNYIAINELQKSFTYELCISVMARIKIHRRIRSAFVRLCTTLWVDVGKYYKRRRALHTRIWKSTVV